MKNYYTENLSSNKLYDVYQTKIDGVNQYLNSEIDFIRKRLRKDSKILELGAGYGRIMKELAPYAEFITGIDISEETVEFGKQYLEKCPNCELKVMDVNNLTFKDKFDIVICLQNGLSAFKCEEIKLIEQVMNILKKDGEAYFSSYSYKFWDIRLSWFQEQVNKGLLGELDMEKTKDGKIVCKDGFTSTTYSQSDMERLGQKTYHDYNICEVANSSIFLTIKK